MFTGKTNSGFAFQVDENALNDMEVVELLAGESDCENEAFAVAKLIKRLLGPEQRTALYNHVRTNEGWVPMEAVGAELEDIIKNCGQQGKNS